MVIYRKLKSEDTKDLMELFKQLTTKEVLFDAVHCINYPNLHCIVLEDNGSIVGFGALVIYRTPAKGLVGRLEDIVIDQRLRGQGYGRELINKLLEIAKEQNLKSVNLTSNPSRVEARRLYENLGFVLKNTGVFQLVF